jgi:hypothetical protein
MKKHPDFVKWLGSQLKAFRARRFEKLDVEAVSCELERCWPVQAQGSLSGGAADSDLDAVVRTGGARTYCKADDPLPGGAQVLVTMPVFSCIAGSTPGFEFVYGSSEENALSTPHYSPASMRSRTSAAPS